MASVVDDILSEQYIAQVLENDLRVLGSLQQAEELQLDHVLAVSARTQDGRIPQFSKTPLPESEWDVDLAFKVYASDALVKNDANYAQAVQNEIQTTVIQDWQYAQKMAAAERKINLDAEFARKLQAFDDEGADIDALKDAESILDGVHMDIDPNQQTSFANNSDCNISVDRRQLKGKSRSITNVDDDRSYSKEYSSLYPTCGICLEPFLPTQRPISASLSANSSTHLPFGLKLPCPSEHGYCTSCLTSYIQNKLDPEGIGAGKSGAVIFPIRCPECTLNEWGEGIQDDVAERILGEAGMVPWYHQKILDSLPRLFCPNPKCSSLVEAEEDSGDPQAMCPVCNKVMCIACRTSWHTGLSCEQYQALPVDERSPEDRLVLELAKAKQWRRCANCAVIVEHVSGCNHMTCRCGFHFCFKCGSSTTKEGKCQRVPPCELWDEELLLEEPERRPAPPVAPIEPVGGIVAQYHYGQLVDDLDWMDNPRILCGRHLFTTNMIRNLHCGYCETRLNSLQDLRYHLLHIRRHPVYACCGRFFRRREDFERHEATLDKLHNNQLLRD